MKTHLPLCLRTFILGASLITISTAGETLPVDSPEINWNPVLPSYTVHSDMIFSDYGYTKQPNRINLDNHAFSISAAENEKGLYSILFESAYNTGDMPYEGSAIYLNHGAGFQMENLKEITFRNNYNVYNKNHSSAAITASESSVSFIRNTSINFLNNAQGIYVGNGSLTMDHNQSILFKDNMFGGIRMALMPGGTLSIQHNALVTFSDNQANNGGGISLAYGSMAISNNGTIEFHRNKALEATGGGGAIQIYNTGNAVFQNNLNIDFIDNSTEGIGGAIGQGSFTMKDNGTITFLRNSAPSSAAVNGGGAVGNNNDATSFINNHEVRFEQNKSGASGGAIKTYGLSFQQNWKLVFDNNTAQSNGGAISMDKGAFILDNNDHTSFTDNIAMASGGAIYVFGGNTTLSGNQNVEFSNNSAGYDGGALSIASPMQIVNNGTVSFTSNRAGTDGGAIRQSTSRTTLLAISGNKAVSFTDNSAGEKGGAINFDYSLSIANNDSTVFRGNHIRTQNGIILNSIYQAARDSSPYGSGKTELSANTGQLLSFYDPITLEAKASLSLNRYTPEGTDIPIVTTGTIVLSGEHAAGDLDAILARENISPDAAARQQLLDQSRLTSVRGQTTLYGGTFLIKENAVYQGSNYQTEAGSITHLRNGGLMNFQQKAVFAPGSTLIVSGARPVGLSAASVSMQGATLEFRLSGTGSVPLLTLTGNADLSGATFNLLADNGHTTLSSGTYTLLQINGDLSQTSSIALNLVGITADKSELAYNPETKTWTWTSENITVEKPADPDEPGIAGDPEETPGTPGDPGHPQNADIPAGLADASINTLWASTQNLDSFSGILRNHSTRISLDTTGRSAVWFDTIGNFYRQSSNGTHAGYDYSAWGAALGGEYQVEPHLQIGAGLGHTFGKNTTKPGYGRIDQDTLLGGAYANIRLMQQQQHSLWLSTTGAFGIARNHGTIASPDLPGIGIRGSWDETVWQLDMRLAWSYAVTQSTAVYAFAGIQYATGKQDAFTLPGENGDYRFTGNSLNRTRIPIGIGIRHNLAAWSFMADASVIPDIARTNPAARIQDTQGNRATVRGVDPGRCAFEFNLGAAYSLTDNWSLTAGYGITTTGDTVQQNARLGTSYSF